MVRAISVGGEEADAVELWIRSASLNVAETRIGAVEIELAGIQKRPFVPDVTHFQSVVGAYLPGNLNVPVLDIRIDVLAIRLNRDHVVKRVLRHERNRHRIL